MVSVKTNGISETLACYQHIYGSSSNSTIQILVKEWLVAS